MRFPRVCQQDVGQGARKRPHPQEMALSNFPGTPEGLSEAVQWVQARFKELEVCWLIWGRSHVSVSVPPSGGVLYGCTD